MTGSGTDGAPRRRLAVGETDAVELLVDRDYPVALLLTRVAVAADVDDDVPERVVVSAIGAVRAGADPGQNLRPALLAAVLRGLVENGWLDRGPAEPPPSAGPFLPEDDRWAGWWQEDVVGWPEEAVPTVDQTVRALRRMPVWPRVALVLRDAAGLSTDDAARVSGHSAAELSLLLESARDWLVGCLEPELAEEAGTCARQR